MQRAGGASLAPLHKMKLGTRTLVSNLSLSLNLFDLRGVFALHFLPVDCNLNVL